MTNRRYLKRSSNTKIRIEYLDNIEYIHGVKDDKGNIVIPSLNEEELDYLNKFNAEYYGNEFDEDDNKNIHKTLVDDNTLEQIKESLSDIRTKIIRNRFKKNFDMAPLYEELEELVNHLCEMYPRKKCSDANNARNRCLMSISKGSSIHMTPLHEVEDTTIGQIDMDLLYISKNEMIDYDEEDINELYNEVSNYIQLLKSTKKFNN